MFHLWIFSNLSKNNHHNSHSYCGAVILQGGCSPAKPTCWCSQTNWGRAAPSHTFRPCRFLAKLLTSQNVSRIQFSYILSHLWYSRQKLSIPTVAASAEQNLIGGAVGLAGGGQCQLEASCNILKKETWLYVNELCLVLGQHRLFWIDVSSTPQILNSWLV